MAEDEIEKKYVLRENGLYSHTDNFTKHIGDIQTIIQEVQESGDLIHQGYFTRDYGAFLRDSFWEDKPLFDEARLREKNGLYTFTIKRGQGTKRFERNQRLTEAQFQNYWSKTQGRRLLKRRLEKPYLGFQAEIDFYLDRPLVIGEVEVKTLEQANLLPPLGGDVTDNLEYKNVNLAR